MIRHKLSFAAILLAILFVAQAHCVLAQQPRLYVQPDSVKIGDIVTYTIVLPQGMQYQNLIYPDSAAFGKDLELLDRKQFRTPSQTDSIQFQLQFFGTADLVIENISIGLINEGETSITGMPSVVLPFKTLLVEEEPELRPMKDIYAFAINWLPYLLLLLLLILIGWVLIRYMRHYLKTKPEPEPIEIEMFQNPLDLLEKKLLSLRSDATLIERDFKPFYTLLGDALREYLERVHDLLALEMTTRELIREMGRRMVDPDLTRQTGVVLKLADMVKFAKYEPSIDQALESIREAEKFLQIARMTDQRRVNEMQRQFDEKQAEEIARKEKEAAQESDNLTDSVELQEEGQSISTEMKS
jgi:hypothetical protein